MSDITHGFIHLFRGKPGKPVVRDPQVTRSGFEYTGVGTMQSHHQVIDRIGAYRDAHPVNDRIMG